MVYYLGSMYQLTFSLVFCLRTHYRLVLHPLRFQSISQPYSHDVTFQSLTRFIIYLDYLTIITIVTDFQIVKELLI